MGEPVISLIPLALGVVMSPLAIMALVAVLVSKRARANGIAYLIGWSVALIAILAASFALFGLLEVRQYGQPPLWSAYVRLFIALLLIVGAVYVYRRGRDRTRQMAKAVTPGDVVAAAPQLPGWLRAVDRFTPARSLLLGFGIFALNPVDLSCAVLAMLDVRGAAVSPANAAVVIVAFAAVGILPIAAPVFYTLVRGAAADELLERVRLWIAGHTSALNAGLLVLIGAMQLQKALSVIF